MIRKTLVELEKSDLLNIKPSLNVDDIKLSFKTFTQGINLLSDIKYYVYTLDKSINGYDSVMFVLFRIDEDSQKEASCRLLLENVSTSLRPHIDGNTGNIHPKRDIIKKSLFYNKTDDVYYEKICQLVLCRSNGKNIGDHPGPRILKITDLTDCYCYSPYTVVHKSCYFPRIDNKKPNNDWRYSFLKKVAEQLPFELLSEELKDYIK